MVIDDGGPAFPNENSENGETQWANGLGGMSLRDWFAGMALQGEVANPNSSDEKYHSEWVVNKCYKLADAMIAERKRRMTSDDPPQDP